MRSIHNLATLALTATLTGCVNTTTDPAPNPQTPVYDFGDSYALIQNDSVPRLQGDTLYAHLGYDCSPTATITLEHFKTGDDTYEIWLNMDRGIHPDCAMPIVDKRVLKVPDVLKNAASVTLVTRQPGTGELVRVELVKGPGEEGAPKQPVYDFGLGYEVIQSDSLPRLRGDSLDVMLAHQCGGGFLVEHYETADAQYEVWLNKHITTTCAMPVVEQRTFKLADEIADARSVVLVTSSNGRVALKK